MHIVVLGHAVAHLVETLHYIREGRGFDCRWCHWDIPLTSLRPRYGPGVDSAPHRNEYQGYFLGGIGAWCVGLTTFPAFICRLPCNLGTSASGNPRCLPRPLRESLYLCLS